MKYAAISKRNAKRPKYGGGKKDRIKPGDEFLGGYRFSKDFGVERGPALKPLHQGEDYGMDPLGDGTFKLVPSGRIAKSLEEAKKMIADSKRNPSERISTEQSGNPRLTRTKQARFLKLVESYALSLSSSNVRKQQQAYDKALQYAQSVGLDFEEALPQAMSHLKKTRAGLSLRHGLDSFRNPGWKAPSGETLYYYAQLYKGGPTGRSWKEASGRTNYFYTLKQAKEHALDLFAADETERVVVYEADLDERPIKSTRKVYKGRKTDPAASRIAGRMERVNPSERVTTGVSEAYATKKGSGTIQSPKKRGPYSVQFMARGGEAVTKNIARLPAARKWLRGKLGVLRKANPATIADAFSGQVMNPTGSTSYHDAKRKFSDKQIAEQLKWQRLQAGRHPSIDHTLLSPSGRASKRSRDAAMAREAKRLFGPLGVWIREPPSQREELEKKVMANRRTIAMWRDLASRGMQVRSLTKQADKMEAITEKLEAQLRKANPSPNQRSADTLFEDFHGKAPTRTVEVRTTVRVREHLAQLGVLTSLKILLLTGEKIELTFPVEGRDAITLASSPDGKQLYFEGGNQEMDLSDLKMASSKWLRDSMVLGVLYQVTYQTAKGFDKFQLTDYYHDLGEETKIQPLLIYDRLSKLLSVSGGQYEVRSEGIVN